MHTNYTIKWSAYVKIKDMTERKRCMAGHIKYIVHKNEHYWCYIQFSDRWVKSFAIKLCLLLDDQIRWWNWL